MPLSSKLIESNIINTMLFVIFVSFVSLALLVFSYAWFDHGLMTVISESHPQVLAIDTYRAFMIYNRHLFRRLFIALITVLFALQAYALLSKKPSMKWMFIAAAIVTIVGSLSYPFLSSDIYSYVFSAKMAWVYKLNPYIVIPEVLREHDSWLNFVLWTHKPYVYGPVALIYSTIPLAIFSAGKLITVLLATKLLNGIVFFVTGFLLFRILNNRLVFGLWFFNPLLIFELLVNAHNETLMIGLFVLSYFLFLRNKKLAAFIIFMTSVLTKFISLLLFPVFFIIEKKEVFFKFAVLILLFSLGLKYASSQAWYFTWIYLALPFAKLKMTSLCLIFVSHFLLIINKYINFVGSGYWSSYGQSASLIFFAALPFLVAIKEFRAALASKRVHHS